MNTLYFSYSYVAPHDPLTSEEPISSPYTVTYNVARYLKARADERGMAFQYVNLDDTRGHAFDADDIVIGHLWHTPGSFVRQALAQQACPVFILQPYSSCMVSQGDVATYCALFERATHCFWITGEAWWQHMPHSGFASLRDRSTRLDMAVNAEKHPYCKATWNPPGRRGFLTIGADIPAKGLDRIAELAQMSGIRLGYFGNAPKERFQHVARFKYYGGIEFKTPVIEQVCRDYDFFLTLGRCDANPTTMLETACWGLVGACNSASGYIPNQPFLELRGDDLVFDWEQVERMNAMPEHELQERSQRLRALMETSYTWDNFTTRLWEGIDQYVSKTAIHT